MSQPVRGDIPWVNDEVFTDNFNKFPREEWFKYAGQYVAFSLDGSRILASGADGPQMEENLKKLGIDPSRVIGMYVEEVDEEPLSSRCVSPRITCPAEDSAMSQPARDDIPWVNNTITTENFNKFPREEWFKYAGQYVAFSLDGSRILASGATEQQMEENLKKLGIDPSRVIGTYVEKEDEEPLS
jgi:hypothetical protein